MQPARFALNRRQFAGVAPFLAGAAPAPVLARFGSKRLRAAVAPDKGGELSSLQVLKDARWIELLYRGGDFSPTPDFEGRAPILWPATGRNFPSPATSSGEWVLEGATSPMPIHGFARRNAWRLLGSTPVSARLRLTDTSETRKLYPFGFSFTADYSISGASLTLSQRITAASGNAVAMPFSIGNHIAFNIPLVPGAPKTVYYETPATRLVMTDAKGRPTGEVQARDSSGPTPLTSLRARTAYSMAGYRPGDIWARLSDAQGFAVTLRHRPDYLPGGEPVLFNLWGDPEAGFFSPEPWVGKQNSLASGDGVIRLSAGSAYVWTISIEVAGSSRDG